MLLLRNLLFAISAVLIFLALKEIYEKVRVIIELKRLVDIFVSNYEEVRGIIGQSLEQEDIMKQILGYDNSKELIEGKTIQIDFGDDVMEFSNCRELRRCFLKAGNYIVECERIVEQYYEYSYNQTDEYKAFLEALGNVKQECLSKGESIVTENIIE